MKTEKVLELSKKKYHGLDIIEMLQGDLKLAIQAKKTTT